MLNLVCTICGQEYTLPELEYECVLKEQNKESGEMLSCPYCKHDAVVFVDPAPEAEAEIGTIQ